MNRFFRRALQLMAEHRALFAGFWVTVLLQLVYKLGLALCLRTIFDQGIIAANGNALYHALAGLVVLIAIFAAASLFQERIVAQLAMRITNRAREQLFATYLSVSPGFHRRNPMSVLIGGLGNDINAVDLALVRGVPPVLLDLTVVLASIAMLFVVEWRLALVAMITVPLIVVVSKPFQRRAASRFELAGATETKLLSLTQEALLGYLQVVVLRVQRHFMDRFSVTLRELGQATWQAHFFSGAAGRSAQVAAGSIQVIVIGFGAWLALRGYMTAGLVIAFVALLANIGDAVGRITAAMPIAVRGAAAFERVEALLASADRLSGAADAMPLAQVAHEIRFEHVSFGYEEGERILDDVSFTIRVGSLIAMVGGSGCGKSTILALLMRLYRPDSGRILIDGRPLESITEDSLRKLVTSVDQAPILFDGSISDNIAIARPEASTHDIKAAARAAAAHDMVMALPEGYGTGVGSAGSRLSGGQRQRVAITRAFLRDAPILLLDEATSALDPISESTVNGSIVAMKGKRTTILVTHRSNVLPNCDDILVFHHGRLVQQGRHSELVAVDGIYRDLSSRREGLSGSADEHPGITVARLRQFAFLAHCATDMLAELAASFLPEQYVEGREILREGEPGDRFFVLARGVVEVLKDTHSAGPERIALLRDGDFFGEISLIASVPRTATVRTLTECTFLVLHRISFLALLDRDAEVKERVIAAMKARQAASSPMKPEDR